MQKKSYLTLAALSIGGVLLSLNSADAQIIVYQQSFSNNTGSNQAMSSYGWTAARSRGGSEASAGGSSTVFTGNAGAGGAAGGNGGSTVADVNATTPFGTGLSEGFVFGSTDGSNSTRLIFTVPTAGMGSWATGGSSVGELSSVSWDQRNNSATTRTRVVIQVDGQWYASQSSFTNPEATVWAAQSLNITASTAWYSLALQGNGSPDAMNTGSAIATSTLSGAVTGIGIYAWTPSGQSARFDTFSVAAIPEPSTYAALLGLSVLALVVYRRRR